VTQLAPNHQEGQIGASDARLILTLRLLLARAANNDSLAWWDDDSFAAPARFVLHRVFPFAPPLAARSLALRAALARHGAAFAARPQALHLYRLDADGLDKLALRFEPLLPIPVPDEPIPTMEALGRRLLTLVGQPQPYAVRRRFHDGRLWIEIPPPAPGLSSLLHRAQTIAWAYLEGAPREPVFPFCVE